MPTVKVALDSNPFSRKPHTPFGCWVRVRQRLTGDESDEGGSSQEHPSQMSPTPAAFNTLSPKSHVRSLVAG